jgi:hypothetical protein
MADDDLSDLEIAVLCDLLGGTPRESERPTNGLFLINLSQRTLSSRPKTTPQNSSLVRRLTTF